MRDPRYEVPFEPVPIGPPTARNRFPQLRHCNGVGSRDPSAAAEMRGIEAEGGRGVILTEPRLWEGRDIPRPRRMSDAMKTHGALAGIQLACSGIDGPNLSTREMPLTPSALPTRSFTNDPVQGRALSKSERRDLRRWFVHAERRARVAGFDLIRLDGAHGLGIVRHFLS